MPVPESDILSEIKQAHGPQMLLVSPAREDHEVLRCMLSDVCLIADVRTCREAVAFLCRDRVPVIFCERDLPDGTWRDILSHVADLADPPALVVTSVLADEYLGAEVLNLGGYDVLAKPFCEAEVKHALAGALRQTTRPRRAVLAAGAAGFE